MSTEKIVVNDREGRTFRATVETLHCTLPRIPEPLAKLVDKAARKYSERMVQQPDLTATNFVLETEPKAFGEPTSFVARTTYSARYEGRDVTKAYLEHWQVAIQGEERRREGKHEIMLAILSIEVYTWDAKHNGWRRVDVDTSDLVDRPASKDGDAWPSEQGW